jgi:uncharacterized membrane protein
VEAAIELTSLLLVGWIAGAELGSWGCVQPVVARLPYEQYVAAEQGMLRTFGRIMPVVMPLSGACAIVLVLVSHGERGVVFWLRVAVAFCLAMTVVTTLTVNVPINRRTARWQMTDDASEWDAMRHRWHAFQGVRGALFGAAFLLLSISVIAVRQ